MKRICQWRTAVGFCELSLWLSLSAVNLEMRMSQGRPAENVGRKWKMVGEKFWEGDNFVGFVLLGESKKFGGRGQSRGICVFGKNFAFFFQHFSAIISVLSFSVLVRSVNVGTLGMPYCDI